MLVLPLKLVIPRAPISEQVLFLILAVFSLLHAVCESRAAEFRRLKLHFDCMPFLREDKKL